jgi:BTB/POZ domain
MSASESSKSQSDQKTMPDAPFDNPGADFILRSCDGVDFRVFKIVLSLASPIFADMFSIPTPSPGSPESQTVHDGLPFVQLSESSTVLDLALRHCYPIRSPELVQSKDALVLLEFGRKYQVEALIPPLTCYLKVLTEREPVSAYCLAVTYRYDDIVEAAARSSLKLPITKLKCDVLHCITGEEYQALIEYHSSCGAAASAVTLGRNWFPTQRSYAPCPACIKEDTLHDPTLLRLPNVSPPKSAPRCLWSYLHRSALLLAHHPSVEAITKPTFVFQNMNCRHCSHDRRADLLDFSQLMAAEVQKAIEKVIGCSAKSR